MIDIKLIREDPVLVKKSMKKRFQNKKLGLVDDVKKKDGEWRKFKMNADSLRSLRNKISEEINKAKKDKDEKKVKELIKKAKEIPAKISKIEEKSGKLKKEIDEMILQIPNIIDNSVPIGNAAADNVVLRKWGKITKKNLGLINHAELIEGLGYADFNAGRNNAGQGFNYLLGDLAILDHALQRYGVDFIIKKGYTLVVPPLLLNFDTLLKVLNGLEDFEEVVYKVNEEDLYLIGTAEHPLSSLHKNKTINKDKLPIKLCASTPCFRKEIGSHGVDTKGLFRMHQFNKVEQVVFCRPEDSPKILEEMQKITEEFFQTLEIPYRVIEICSGDLGAKFSKQYDIEAWFPRQGKYAEVTSAGNCTDFQSRSLNTKYLDKGEKKYPHILNNTMIATSRAIVAIIENFQQKDGSIKIPKALQKYTGFKEIRKK